MATLLNRTFVSNLKAISYNHNIYLLSPISRTKTIKVKVTIENVVEALAHRDPDMEVGFSYDDDANLMIGLSAQAINEIHTKYLKSRWEAKQREHRILEEIEASGGLTLMEV